MVNVEEIRVIELNAVSRRMCLKFIFALMLKQKSWTHLSFASYVQLIRQTTVYRFGKVLGLSEWKLWIQNLYHHAMPQVARLMLLTVHVFHILEKVWHLHWIERKGSNEKAGGISIWQANNKLLGSPFNVTLFWV